jgi:hypothetical protein
MRDPGRQPSIADDIVAASGVIDSPNSIGRP